jgi:hypothetical protein
VGVKDGRRKACQVIIAFDSRVDNVGVSLSFKGWFTVHFIRSKFRKGKHHTQEDILPFQLGHPLLRVEHVLVGSVSEPVVPPCEWC